MILKLEIILSVVSYEMKNITFYEKHLKFTKNNTFNNVFCDTIFSRYRFLPTFQTFLDVHESWLIFLGQISSKTLLFLILKVKF